MAFVMTPTGTAWILHEQERLKSDLSCISIQDQGFRKFRSNGCIL